jgi:hypothetical protein
MLAKNEIQIRGLSTDSVNDPVLLGYLASHTGFRSLEFHEVYLASAASEEKIYTEVLPAQRETLTRLKLDRSLRRAGSRVYSLSDIVTCQQVRILSVHYRVTADELNYNDVLFVVRSSLVPS